MTNPYFNTNTTGGTLQGIASILQGLGSLNDPGKASRQDLLKRLQDDPSLRDKIIQQTSGNPDAINTLLGRRPFIGAGGYDKAKSLLSGPLSKESQLKLDTETTNLALAKSRATYEEALARQEGTKADESDRIAKRNKKDEEIATSYLAANPGNLYLAHKSGKMSDDIFRAVMNYPKASTQYKDEQDDYWKEQGLNIDRERLKQSKQQLADSRRALLINRIYERALDAGAPISEAQINQMIDRPAEILKSNKPEDQPMKTAFTDIRDFESKNSLVKAKAEYISAYKAFLSSTKGKVPTQADIDNLNNESRMAFAGTAYAAPVHALEDITLEKRAIFPDKKGKTVKIVSIDPALKDIIPKGVSVDSGEAKPKANTVSPNLPPLSADDKAKAEKEPAFKQFLISKGYKF